MKGSIAKILKINLIIIVFLQLFACNRQDETSPLLPVNFTLIQQSRSVKFILNSNGLSDCKTLSYKVYFGDSLVLENLVADTFGLTGLKESTYYKGRIDAYCQSEKIGSSNFSFSTPATLSPDRPEIERLDISSSSLKISWKPVTDPDSKVITYYIYLNQELKDSLSDVCFSEISGLKPQCYYILRLVARDESGNQSEEFMNFHTLAYGSGTLVRKWMKFGGYSREANWYVPPSFGNTPVPLVINLHGANGNAWQEIQNNDFNRLATKSHFIHLMPQALLGTFNGETIYQWNAHYIFPWDDAAFIDYLIDELRASYAIDTSRLYLTGMSNGGFMTFFAAVKSRYQWAAIAPIAGLITMNVFSGYTLPYPIPLCYMHGSADPIVPINGVPSAADIIDFWVENTSCSPVPEVTQLPDLNTSDQSTVTVYQYKGFTSRSEVMYYLIEGGGHSVPGIETGSNRDINAYEEIWKFFSRHHLQ